MTVRTLQDQLRRQLGYIERSSQMYDEGYDDEALRIATAIRVLLHDTHTSTSVLHHLGVKGEMQLLTTVPPLKIHPGGSVDGISALGVGRNRLVHPKLGGSNFQALVSVSEWWEQAVIARDGKGLTRRAMVLMGANKDGGAHVDLNIGEDGLLMREGGFWTDGVLHGRPIDLGDIHLVGLRQFGYEILNSPSLLKAARR